MKRMVLGCFGALSLLGMAPAQADTPPRPSLPPYETDPAKLPKVFALGIRVADMAKSVRFYREAMGATSSMQVTPREVALTFASGSGINLLQIDPNSAPTPQGSGVGFIFQTMDIDGLAARVKAMGGTIEREPSDGSKTMGIRLAMIRDPDGVRIELIQFPKS